MRLACLLWSLLASALAAQDQTKELVIRPSSPIIDGELTDWPADSATFTIGTDRTQVIEGIDVWSGAPDISGTFMVGFDANRLYLAGTVIDDHISEEASLYDRGDRIEVYLGSGVDPSGASMSRDDNALYLKPLQRRRPWSWANTQDSSRGAVSQLSGLEVAGKQIDANTYQFEAAIPFHHFPSLRPGMRTLGFDLVLRDVDPSDGGRASVLSWNGRDPTASKGLSLLQLPEPGAMGSIAPSGPLLSSELLADLPYLLVPLVTLIGLLFLGRSWPRIRNRARWLRPMLIIAGAISFLLGLLLPSLLSSSRDEAQRAALTAAMDKVESTLGKFDPGTLTSYRGASRDRAVIDLLAGKVIARQRYTSYRSLAQIAPTQFGPPVREFDGLPVRPYWLPLSADRAESFQFDPPLKGSRVHLVVARPFSPTFTFPSRPANPPRLELELDLGADNKRTQSIELDRPFADGSSLGRDFWEVCVVPVTLDRDLRALTVGAQTGSDLRLVGITLEGAQPGQADPLLLGAPSRDGVLTDLRGPYPQDAGIELAPGATAKVTVPAGEESPQGLWFFYEALYPGLPVAHPGAHVAEIVLHFADGRPKRSIALEHQVSMFYELAVHNTRDDPPEGSPASIALSWVDDAQERHVNLGYPVLGLPTDVALEAIEFRNLAEYRMRFRSVVFVNERAAAPQDPPDSPLIGEGPERRLPAAFLAELKGANVSLYRGGRLSESTLPSDQRQDIMSLPRTGSGTERITAQSILRAGGRRLVMSAPLRGDGWDGAVLAVSSTDSTWAAAGQDANRLGFLLCLLSTPILLVLLSELLTIVTNLRFRLMSVMSVASLAPLGVLSLVLVQVLEGGHAADVEEGMRATVHSALGQMDNQKARVQTSAQQWLHDLATLAESKLQGVSEAQLREAAPAVGSELQKLLAGQLPPEWHGGFLRLEWQPSLGKTSVATQVLITGDERMANVETPARLDPGIFMQWGSLMLGVRAEQSVRGGSLALTAGRPLDGSLLGALAPGHDLLLTDVRGYPIAASADRPAAALLLRHAADPATMAQREHALAMGIEQRKAIVERGSSSFGDYVFGSEVLRDLQDTPRGLLIVAAPDQRATLDLAIGRIPVRAFFLLVAGSLVVLSAFLSFVVSGRISRPIELLEHGAQSLSRGALETRVAVDEGGQIGRLTRTFNQMAADLQARLMDLQALNRAMGELSAEQDEDTTLDVLRRFCQSHTAADSVRIALSDAAGQGLDVHPGGGAPSVPVTMRGPDLAKILGAFTASGRSGELPPPWSAVAPGCRSLIGMPIAFGGRVRGILLLGFERVDPLPVDLELLSTVVAQAASAFERSQLQRLAVQDPVTGTFTLDYFRRRVVDEVSLAQQRGDPLSMVAIALGAGDRRPRGLRRFTAVLRETLPANAVLCHLGSGRFQVAMPASTREQAEKAVRDVAAAWAEVVTQLPENEVEEQAPAGLVVQFPDEAPSAEFLFEALRARLAALHEPGAAAMESDEMLQRAGVTSVSPAMRTVYGTLRRVAPTDLPILFEGETGVGKEVLTNLVHRWSRRAGGPLIKVHCAALSETLLASELFGHEKGAFTGAERRKIGRFEQADGGTLFLDEVGEIPHDVQVKLLRVLQEGEVDRVGGTEPVKVDVRVVAATNRDMAKMVAQGTFREDLYYRLQGMVVRVPSLRERRQELGDLVEHFRREIVASGHAVERRLSTDAMDELYRQEWPGNIRQLRNTVFRAMVLARGEVVQLRDVQAALAGSHPIPAGARTDASVAPEIREVSPASPAVLPTMPPRAPEPAPTAVAPSPDPVVPRLDTVRPAPPAAGLSPRLEGLLRMVRDRGRYSTREHMADHGVSHRTALRDLQSLVQTEHLERVGSRRGAFYRPRGSGG